MTDRRERRAAERRLKKEEKKLLKKESRAERDASEEAQKLLAWLDGKRQAYKEQWTVNASAHEAAGDYEWMADKIRGLERVLEIGVGTGNGTLAMIKRGHKVFGIDENHICLTQALQRLKEAGIEPVFHTEAEYLFEATHYDIRYSVPQAPGSWEQVLLQFDVSYREGHDWLAQQGPFDAVVCWLIGTHEARGMNKVACRITNSGEYRLLTQNAVYELADKALRPEGLLHIVDRGRSPDTEVLFRGVTKLHTEQAAGTSLVLWDIDARPAAVAGSGSLPVVPTPGTAAIQGDTGPIEGDMALVSIISRKHG